MGSGDFKEIRTVVSEEDRQSSNHMIRRMLSKEDPESGELGKSEEF